MARKTPEPFVGRGSAKEEIVSVPMKPLDRIVPLGGGVGTHLHIYDNGYHMADNLPGGAKTFYDLTPNGEINGMRLKIPGLSSIDLR